MKINHRIALRGDNPFWDDVQPLGLNVDRDDLISVLNITEDNPVWPAVERLLVSHGSPSQFITNIFTESELNAAVRLQAFSMGHHGYPQPEEDFGYQEITYDITNRCSVCGIGGVQKAAFRFRSEPKVLHSQFIQLNWVFDELFVRSKVRDALTAAGITGVEYIAPTLHRNNLPSAQVVQMKIRSILRPALNDAGLDRVTCKPNNEEGRPPVLYTAPEGTAAYCGRVKYHIMHKGPFRFHSDAFDSAPDVVKSHEWFGSGAQAFRLIVVSQRFRQLVIKAKWRGLGFEPVELVSEPT